MSAWLRGLAAAVAFALVAGGATAAPAAPSPQILGHIGTAAPFQTWLAMAPNGRAAVLWALSPRLSGTPLELATAAPGGRFGPAQVIGKAPFGVLTVGLAIANSGAVAVAVGPDTGGLFVICRSPNGRVGTAQHLVGRRQWVASLSLAASTRGAMVLAWDSQPSRAQGDGPDAISAAWLRPGQARFGRRVALAAPAGNNLPHAAFVSASRAVVAWTEGSGPSGLTRAELAFGNVGAPFGPSATLATTNGIIDLQVVADGHGGAFAAVSQHPFFSRTFTLSALDVHHDGTKGPVIQIAQGRIGPVQVTGGGRGRALLNWQVGPGIRFAMLGPSSAGSLPGALVAPAGGDDSLAIDPAGVGIAVLSRMVRPTSAEPLFRYRFRYRVASFAGATVSGPAHPVGIALDEPPQVAIDNHGRALILWAGPRSARAPVEVLRVRAIRPSA